MSRSGYSDEYEHVELWRCAVERAIHGARGQHFLRKLRSALDAMPAKRLITDEIVNHKGEVCALGALDPTCAVDPEDSKAVGKHFGIARVMAAEIVYTNDEYDEWSAHKETPEERWIRMRAWVEAQIVPYEDE